MSVPGIWLFVPVTLSDAALYNSYLREVLPIQAHNLERPITGDGQELATATNCLETLNYQKAARFAPYA